MTIHEAAHILNLHNYNGASDWMVATYECDGSTMPYIMSSHAEEHFGYFRAIKIAEQLHKYLILCVKVLNLIVWKRASDWRYDNGVVKSTWKGLTLSVGEVIEIAENHDYYD